MTSRTALGTLEGAGPSERMLVALKQAGDGSVAIELLQQHYGEGIGWFNQRSMTLDPRQWQQLQTLLGKSKPAEQFEAMAGQQRDVLPFPGPSETPGHRRAAGSR